MENLEYGQVYTQLNFGVAIVVFFKKNGELRTMLASRSPQYAAVAGCSDKMAILSYRDKTFNRESGNIAVLDLIKQDARAFNVGRVVYYEPQEIRTAEEFDRAILRQQAIEEWYRPLREKVSKLTNLDDMALLEAYARPDIPASEPGVALSAVPTGDPMARGGQAETGQVQSGAGQEQPNIGVII